MKLGEHLKSLRESHALSLRDVERIAKEKDLGAELSSGYISMLERDEVKTPSPRILYALAKVYESNYLDLMKDAGYLPEPPANQSYTAVAFRGASHLDDEQRKRIQRIIDFELSESKKSKKSQINES